MASQFIILKDTGADRDHLRAHASSCPDIFRRVANEAGDSILAKSAPRLVHTLTEDVDTHLAMVAKTAKAEELPQASSLDFMPADRFQISGSHA